MRVSSETEQLDLAPGSRADLTLNVVNTGTVIDGITARVVGMPERNVTTRPPVLPLFPDASGQLVVTLGLPVSYPAGRHPMTVEVLSRQPGTAPQYVNLDLVVPQAPALGLNPRPEVVRAHRSARFILTVANRGNIPLDVSLAANDPQKTIAVRLQPATMTIPAGGAVETVLSVRGPRMVLGTETDRQITLTGTARTAGTGLLRPPAVPLAPEPLRTAPVLPELDEPVDDVESAPDGDKPIVATCIITLRQRPWLTRGLLTALILISIVALWAAVFLFGLAKVFAGDPLTKSAPASFFAPPVTAAAGSTATAGGAGSATSAPSGGQASGADGGTANPPAALPISGPAPAGALAKDGTLPPGLGGTVTGTVTATSDSQPVGRILVEALRLKADGSLVAVASAATQTDGSYEVAGLFPGDYLLRFSATGFNTVYYPAAAGEAAATKVPVTSGKVAANANAVITGKAATISGSIDPGNTTVAVVATITVRPLDGTAVGKAVATVTTKPDLSYTIPNIPAPGTYQLSFTAPGYQPTNVSTPVAAGTQRYEATVTLGSALGTIAGTVTDGTTPLGGVTVSTTVNGKTVTTGTPTTGDVGHFVLSNLPTPATYVLTFTSDSHGQLTDVVDLGAGQAQNALAITLAGGTGTIDGRLVDGTGVGLGGATVTVGGAANPPTTTTLTSGAVGTFHLAGLPTPGAYTLTFSLAGYADQTTPIVLPLTSTAPQTFTMVRSLGRITGTVTSSTGKPLLNIAVSATDGQKTWPVITTGASGSVPAGGYVIANLPPGVYTLTATSPAGTVGTGATAGTAVTAVVTVEPGADATWNFVVSGGG